MAEQKNPDSDNTCKKEKKENWLKTLISYTDGSGRRR